MKLIGPFSQILTLDNIPLKGAVKDEALEILPEAGVLVEHGMIVKAGDFDSLRKEYKEAEIEEVDQKSVLLPG